MRQPQQSQRLRQRRHRGPGRQPGRGQRVELERGRRDDAQRALRADQQVAQVVAGVVFAQARQAVPDLALGRDHLQAQAQVARIAVAQHLGATGVGAQVAAYGATALGGQTEREQKAGRLGLLLHAGQNAASLGRQGQVVGVEPTQLVHPLQAQHQLAARVVGRAAQYQPSVAALRHDADRLLGVPFTLGDTGLHHSRHLGGAAWPHHGQSAPSVSLAPVLFPGAEVTVGQDMGGPQRGPQLIQQRLHGSGFQCRSP